MRNYLEIIEDLHDTDEIAICGTIEDYHNTDIKKGVRFYWQIMKACDLFYATKTTATDENDYNYKQELWKHRYEKKNSLILEYCKSKGAEVEKNNSITLTTTFNEPQLIKVWDLIKSNFDKKNNVDDWLYAMGKTKTKNTKQLKWKKADSTLTNIIYQICNTSSKNTIETFFVYKSKYQKPTKADYEKKWLFAEIEEIKNS